jgi:hypothetical protein
MLRQRLIHSEGGTALGTPQLVYSRCLIRVIPVCRGRCRATHGCAQVFLRQDSQATAHA